MFKKKLVFVVAGILFGCLGMSTQASAAAQGGAENFTVDENANQAAVEIVAANGDLENSPVPVENLTTQQPYQLSSSPIMRTAVKSRRFYRVDAGANLPASLGGGVQWRNNYLVPVGFNWSDNGIPSSVWNYTSVSVGEHFVFHNVEDTGTGGYGTGGYYWRYFRSRAKNGVYLHFWLSAWDLNHLIYG